VELDVGENLRARAKVHLGPGRPGRTDRGQRGLGFAQGVYLPVELAVALNRQLQPRREGVNHRDTDAMQTTGDLVGVVVELTASMQHGHDHLGCRAPLLRMQVDRDTAPVIGHRDRFVGVDGDGDPAAVPGQRLVDGVVDHLEDHVVQAGAVIGVANVHARALAHGIESLEDLDVRGVVVATAAHAVVLGRSFHRATSTPQARLGAHGQGGVKAWVPCSAGLLLLSLNYTIPGKLLMVSSAPVLCPAKPAFCWQIAAIGRYSAHLRPGRAFRGAAHVAPGPDIWHQYHGCRRRRGAPGPAGAGLANYPGWLTAPCSTWNTCGAGV